MVSNTTITAPRLFLFSFFFVTSFIPALNAQEAYQLGADSKRQDGIPQGKVTQKKFDSSSIFKGTSRDYWVYVPKQYDASKPASLMVFQDGHTYVNPKGDFRATIVMDNLIHKKEMPVTIGIFVNPGHKGNSKIPSAWKSNNRSFEYDTLSDDYARFLTEELIPEVAKDYTISDDPNQRGICGISSGGICAFTVAWEKPDQFRKVLSHVGSFTNIRGGHNYAAYIRKTKMKPIRVFLQAGEKDLDNRHGNWPLANQQMQKSLAFMKYDYKFVMGTEGHNGKHGGAILPESLKWLWRK